MEGLIGSDDFYLVANPIRRQIYPAAVATGFDPLFDHLLTVYFKFHLANRCFSSGFFLIIVFLHIYIFCIRHVKKPLPFFELSGS